MINSKKIAIIGAGESGVGTALLANAKGFDVWLSDNNTIKSKYVKILNEAQINFEENGHNEGEILSADILVKSPGVPPTAPLIVKAKQKGIKIIGEIEFAYAYTNAKIIAITGSNGKTTTAKLTYHILKKAGLDVLLAGNVGDSLALKLFERDYDYIVLELSSFQLDDMETFKSDISILMNITPDHLDRYEYDFNKYADSKFQIVRNMTENDVFIYNMDDEKILELLKNNKPKCQCIPFSLSEMEGQQGAWLANKQITINIKDQLIMSIHDLALKGKHNAQNSMASGIAGRVLEIRKESIRESLSDFQNVEHRLEFVAKVHGVEFINDSKATNVNASWYALESMEQPTVWIVGGVDKGNDYSMLDELVAEKVKAIVCLGEDNAKIIDHFKDMVNEIHEVSSAREAVNLGYQLAVKDSSVLLSPACASFDLFDSYEDRGNQFKKAVRAL